MFAMVDTNSDPGIVDFPVPSNDDAFKSITIITDAISKAVEEGLMERKQDKEESKRREEEAAKIKADQEGDNAEAAEAAKKQPETAD